MHAHDSRIYKSSKGDKAWKDMVPPYLRNAAAKLRRQAEWSEHRSKLLKEAEEMEAYAEHREAEWAKEHQED